ncbi:uncharacterized protein LOC116339892 [Contarinia nasturtii]|uniref:uncharacterized protein LOC116339892 n=1 Tax=Contarinia nasturtii TaxID=265458 RepID=UPI0012D4BDD4|nr:uncharacterized protein LOC116339892 [Contarinia nasturtii]
MYSALFVFSLIVAVTVLVTRDAMSSPQIGAQFGEIHNNGTGGGNGASLTPYEPGNSSSSIAGSGYPEFYSSHANDSSPTSPSMSGGSMDLQNSTWASSGCDCSQVSNAQDITPSNAPTDNSSDGSTANDAVNSASSSSSS